MRIIQEARAEWEKMQRADKGVAEGLGRHWEEDGERVCRQQEKV